jgi:hypothetical protein
MNFKDWFRSQRKRDDAVGLASDWFFSKRSRVRVEAKDEDQEDPGWWERVIERSAGRSYRKWLLGAVRTAWSEWVFAQGKNGKGDSGFIDVMKVRSTVARVSLSVKGPRETGGWEHEDIISVAKFIGPVAHVGLKAKLTVNLGNYDSASVEGMCIAPCYIEEMGEMGELVDEIAVGKLNKQMEELVGVKGDTRHFGDVMKEATEPFKPEKKAFKGKAGMVDDFINSDGERALESPDEIVSEEVKDEQYEPAESSRDNDDVLF